MAEHTNITKPEETTYYIAYNADKSIIHHGEVTSALCMETDLEFIEETTSEVTHLARKEELGIEEDIIEEEDILEDGDH